MGDKTRTDDELTNIIRDGQLKQQKKMKINGKNVVDYIASKYIPKMKSSTNNEIVEENLLIIKNGSKFVIDSYIFRDEDMMKKIFNDISNEIYIFMDTILDSKINYDKTKAELAMINIMIAFSKKIKN